MFNNFDRWFKIVAALAVVYVLAVSVLVVMAIWFLASRI
jgi:hypothetical protein